MKKALALVMAIAMIASMAAVAMAATEINPTLTGTKPVGSINIDGQLYKFAKKTGFAAYADTDAVVFGSTVYVPFVNTGYDWATDGLVPSVVGDGYVTDSDAVKGLNVSAKWTQGAEYVKSVEIVKVGNDTFGKVYAIAIATTGSSLEEVSVVGEIAVKGKSYYEVVNGTKLEGKKADVKFDFDVELDLAYPSFEAKDKVDGNGVLNVSTKTVYDFETVAKADQEDFELAFGPFDVETDVKNMKKVLMAYNADASAELLDAYVDADLTFINCVANFRRTATVTVDLADDEFFYEIVDGVLNEVDGEYDEWTEEFTFKTRKLGNYVISDTELVVAEEVVATNPSTGAAA